MSDLDTLFADENTTTDNNVETVKPSEQINTEEQSLTNLTTEIPGQPSSELDSLFADEKDNSEVTIIPGYTPDKPIEGEDPLTFGQYAQATQGNIPGIMEIATKKWGYQDAKYDEEKGLLLKKDGKWYNTEITADENGRTNFNFMGEVAEEAIPSMTAGAGMAMGGAIGTMIMPVVGTAIGAGIGGLYGWLAGTDAKRAFGNYVTETYKATGKEFTKEQIIQDLSDGAYDVALGEIGSAGLKQVGKAARFTAKKVSGLLKPLDKTGEEFIKRNPINLKESVKREATIIEDLTKSSEELTELQKQAQENFDLKVLDNQGFKQEENRVVSETKDALKTKIEREAVILEESNDAFEKELISQRKAHGKKLGDARDIMFEGPAGNKPIDVTKSRLIYNKQGELVDAPPLYDTVEKIGIKDGYIENPIDPDAGEFIRASMKSGQRKFINNIFNRLRRKVGVSDEIEDSVKQLVQTGEVDVTKLSSVENKQFQDILAGKTKLSNDTIDIDGSIQPPTARSLNELRSVIEEEIGDIVDNKPTKYQGFLMAINKEIKNTLYSPTVSPELGMINLEYSKARNAIDTAYSEIHKKSTSLMQGLAEGRKGLKFNEIINDLEKHTDKKGWKYLEEVRGYNKRIEGIRKEFAEKQARLNNFQKNRDLMTKNDFKLEKKLLKEQADLTKERLSSSVKALESLNKSNDWVHNRVVHFGLVGMTYGVTNPAAIPPILAVVGATSPRFHKAATAYMYKKNILNKIISKLDYKAAADDMDVLRAVGVDLEDLNLNNLDMLIREAKGKLGLEGKAVRQAIKIEAGNLINQLGTKDLTKNIENNADKQILDIFTALETMPAERASLRQK